VGGSKLPADLDARLKKVIALRTDLATLDDGVGQLRQRAADTAARGYEIRDSLEAIANVKTAGDLRKKLTADLAANNVQSQTIATGPTPKQEAAPVARAPKEPHPRDRDVP